MRVAVVADIHGNLGALQAVVADLRDASPDLVLNLGDCLSGPLDPAGTADLLLELGWTTVRGNHDREVADAPITSLRGSDRSTAERISERHRAWLRALPPTLTLAPDLYLCHGTPASDMEYLTERVAADGSVHAAREADMARETGVAGASVVLCGHTHVPRLFRLKNGRFVVNPGSVGLPGYEWDVPALHVMEVGTPHARYLIMDRVCDTWRFDFRALSYDWHAAAAMADKRGSAWSRVLATGFVK